MDGEVIKGGDASGRERRREGKYQREEYTGRLSNMCISDVNKNTCKDNTTRPRLQTLNTAPKRNAEINKEKQMKIKETME